MSRAWSNPDLAFSRAEAQRDSTTNAWGFSTYRRENAYFAARRSRNQRSAAVSAGPAAAGRNGTKAWSETGASGGSDALRLVHRTQPRSEKSSRIVTISTDTDKQAVPYSSTPSPASLLRIRR